MSNGDADRRAVFVIHGRNEKARRAMFYFLRCLNLRPLEWNHLIKLTGQGSPYVEDILKAGFRAAQAAVVLFTPDDEARLRAPYHSAHEPPYETSLTPQPRPNVIFEAGMALGMFPERTILVQFGDCRPFSDLLGRYFVRLSNSYDSRHDLAQRLQTVGCDVDTDCTDWLKGVSFDGAVD